VSSRCAGGEETFQQGGLLTLEDLANLFNCAVRTLVADLAALRREGLTLPLRSTVKDMGRAITHRRQIVELWMQGLEYSEIALRTCHSVQSVANYVEKFKRCAALLAGGFDLHTVAFVARLSTSLARAFHDLHVKSRPVPHRQQELADFLKKNDLLPTPEVSRP
jgi:DNA-binding CsgD family transcriptional regulator